MRSIHYLTFGGGRADLRRALESRKRQAERSHFFSSIITVSDNDLKNDHSFWDRHGTFVERNPRGYGYWLWKPYIIMKYTNMLPDGDILYYADVGCEVNRLGKFRLNEYNQILDNQELLLFELNHPAKKWTKGDLLELFPSLRERNQLVGGVIGLKIGRRSRELAAKWLELCCQNSYHYLDDSPSITQNDLIFREHRHDQACLTAVATKYNSLFFLNENEFDFNTMADKPFLVLRNRTDKLKSVQVELFGKKYIILKRGRKFPKVYTSRGSTRR